MAGCEDARFLPWVNEQDRAPMEIPAPKKKFTIRNLDGPVVDTYFDNEDDARFAWKGLTRPNAGMTIKAELWIRGQRIDAYHVRARDNGHIDQRKRPI